MKPETRAKIYFIGIIVTLVTLFILLFGGCVTLEKCNAKFPSQIHDSISYIEKTILDTSYQIIHGDTVQIKVPIPCPDFNTSATSGKSKIQVIVKDHYLTANCTSKEDSLKIVTACQEKEKMNQKTIEVKVPIYKATTWSWWSLMFNILFIGLGIIYWKFKK